MLYRQLIIAYLISSLLCCGQAWALTEANSVPPAVAPLNLQQDKFEHMLQPARVTPTRTALDSPHHAHSEPVTETHLNGCADFKTGSNANAKARANTKRYIGSMVNPDAMAVLNAGRNANTKSDLNTKRYIGPMVNPDAMAVLNAGRNTNVKAVAHAALKTSSAYLLSSIPHMLSPRHVIPRGERFSDYQSDPAFMDLPAERQLDQDLADMLYPRQSPSIQMLAQVGLLLAENTQSLHVAPLACQPHQGLTQDSLSQLYFLTMHCQEQNQEISIVAVGNLAQLASYDYANLPTVQVSLQPYNATLLQQVLAGEETQRESYHAFNYAEPYAFWSTYQPQVYDFMQRTPHRALSALQPVPSMSTLMQAGSVATLYESSRRHSVSDLSLSKSMLHIYALTQGEKDSISSIYELTQSEKDLMSHMYELMQGENDSISSMYELTQDEFNLSRGMAEAALLRLAPEHHSGLVLAMHLIPTNLSANSQVADRVDMAPATESFALEHETQQQRTNIQAISRASVPTRHLSLDLATPQHNMQSSMAPVSHHVSSQPQVELPIHLCAAPKFSTQPAPYGALDPLAAPQRQSQPQARATPPVNADRALQEAITNGPFKMSEMLRYGMMGRSDIMRNQMEYNVDRWIQNQVGTAIEQAQSNIGRHG